MISSLPTAPKLKSWVYLKIKEHCCYGMRSKHLINRKGHSQTRKTCYQTGYSKNMTHLLQPLDLTTNASVKKMEKRAFSDYFTSTITEAMLQSPQRDVLPSSKLM